MTNEEAQVIQVAILQLNDFQLAMRRAVRERQRRSFPHCPEIMEVVETDIAAIEREALSRGLRN